MRFEVLEKSFINNQIVEPGTIVNWEPPENGKVGKNLKPLDEQEGGGKKSSADDLV